MSVTTFGDLHRLVKSFCTLQSSCVVVPTCSVILGDIICGYILSVVMLDKNEVFWYVD